MAVTAQRKSAEERREAVLEAALEEFAARGLEGASTEAIAAKAGISQPYVFRLFGTKKELFKAVVSRCFRQTLELFQRAAPGPHTPAGADAGLRRLRGRRDPRGRPQWLRGPRRLRGKGLRPAPRGGRSLLRDRDAPERHCLDGTSGPRGALGRAAGRRPEDEVSLSFSTPSK